MADVNFSVQQKGDIYILKVVGSVDAHNAPQFANKIKEVLVKSKKLVMEVSGLEYIATAGLGALMANLNTAKTQGGDIIMAGMTDKIKKVFATMGFTNVVKIVPSVDDAKF
jgi:anti-anti-sigma factor